MRHLLAVLVLCVLAALPAAPALAGFYDLLDAARMNDTELARRLLAEGTEPNGGPSGFPQSYAPLMWAARHGNIELMRLLLAAGAETERRDFNGDRAMLWAAEAGQAEAVSLLLAAGSPADSALDPYGMTPLAEAAWRGHADISRHLLAAGADVDALDQSGMTPLFYAIWALSAETVDVLLAAGADPSLMDQGLGQSPLHEAAVRTDPAIVARLVEAGADLAARNGDGLTALHIAAWRGLPDNVAVLLEGGADPDAPDGAGRTPILAAIEGKPFEFADNDAAAALLAAVIADPTSAFAPAVFAGMQRTALILLSRGADPNALGADGEPVLAGAAALDDPALFEALIRAGASVERFGRAALFSAARSNRTAIAERLLALGVPLDLAGSDGRTALHHAAQAGAVEMVQLLLARGAAPIPAESVVIAAPAEPDFRREDEPLTASLKVPDHDFLAARAELRRRQREIQAILAAAF